MNLDPFHTPVKNVAECNYKLVFDSTKNPNEHIGLCENVF